MGDPVGAGVILPEYGLIRREEAMLGGIRSVEVSSAKVRPDFGCVIGSWAQALILLTVALLSAPGCGYDIIVDYHDAERAHQGVTFVTNFDQQRLTAIDMDGTVVWDLEVRDSQWLPGQANGFRVQGDGTICYLLGGGPILANLSPFELLFEGTYLEGHHSIMMTPHDTFMVVAADVFVLNEPPFDKFPCVRGDKLLEVDLDGNIVWEWILRDYAPPLEYHDPEFISSIEFSDGCHDWSHGNSVKFVKDYYFYGDGQLHDIVVYNSAGLHTFFVIDYNTREVLYSCGQFGTLGSVEYPERPYFYPAHEVEYVRKDGQYDIFILYDNGLYQQLRHSRAVQLKINPVTEEVILDWEWTEPWMYSWFGADADVLPNDNVLITNTTLGELIEVTREGDVVWKVRFVNAPLPTPNWIYQSQRVPYAWVP